MADNPGRFDRIANLFDGLKKIGIGAGVLLAGLLVAVAVGRELLSDGIVIEPVVVKDTTASDALTPELAGQQIARQLDLIQRAGAEEWRRAHIEDGVQSLDLQIPGSPLSVRGLAREMVALVGLAPRALRISITRRTIDGKPAGYSAVVGLANDHGAMAACPERGPEMAPDKPDTGGPLEAVYDCIARNAVAFVDPKLAAAYVLQGERLACKGLNAGLASDSYEVEKEQLRIRNRRDACSFRHTHEQIAEIMKRGRKLDLPWVPYIFGQIHLARAEALREIGLQQRLSEFDQAIGRFKDARRLLPDSSTPVAVLMGAYLAKGIAIHESTSAMKWTGPDAEVLQFRLDIAQGTLKEARDQLKEISILRPDSLGALVDRNEGLLNYRTWMIMAHRRTHSGDVVPAIGKEAELKDEWAMLDAADANFEAAAKVAPLSGTDYMHWGNVLRGRGKFELAVAKYRRAADLAPTDSDPALNISVAYLDRVIHAKDGTAPDGDVLTALGSLSDYLAWKTGGGPYTLILPKTEEALGHTTDPDDKATFVACLKKKLVSLPVSDQAVEKWRAAATYKLCVDEAIVRINNRLMGQTQKKVEAKRD